MSKIFFRETTVRATSRGGDFIIANLLMMAYGDTLFFYATIIGALWNGGVDYFGQRFWTYKPSRLCRKRLLHGTLPYVVLRAVIAIGGFGTLSFLFFMVSLPYMMASIITTLLFWAISYRITKVFFTGSSHGQPQWFRYFWVALRRKARNWLRTS